MTVEIQKSERGRKCDVIIERLHDGIHDKTCGMNANAAVSDGNNKVAFCTTHSDSLLRYVSQTFEVPEYWDSTNNTPATRATIKNANRDCQICSE